jgi:hypothetical protein
MAHVTNLTPAMTTLNVGDTLLRKELIFEVGAPPQRTHSLPPPGVTL